MRRLTFLRHAEAEQIDFDRIPTDDVRPLSEAGIRAARAIAKQLAAEMKVHPHIVTSPARRTLETTALVAAALGLGTNAITIAHAAYAASADTLLGVVQQQPDNVEHLLLCGHNPGLSALARYLAAAAPPSPLAPCALVTFTFDVARWADITRASGQLTRFWES